MLHAYRSLMGSQQPPLQQGRHPMHSRQQPDRGILAFTQQNRHFMAVSKRLHASIRPKPVGMHNTSRLDGPLDKAVQVRFRCLRNASHTDSSYASSIFFCSDCHQCFVAYMPPSASAKSGILSTHVGFIHLHAAVKLVSPRTHHRPTQLVQPRPSRLIASKPQNLLQTRRAGAVLLAGHMPNGSKPQPQWLANVLKDRAGGIIAIEGVELHDAEKKKSNSRSFSLEVDLPRLAEVLDDYPDIRLVVIDPVSAYCGRVDSHKNADVRGLLAPLAELASRRRTAILAVTHLAKSGAAKAIYRPMGSLAFAAAARAVWAVAQDSADPQRRLFLPAKLNLARDPLGLAYRITEGRVAWDIDPVHMHADEVFAAELATANRTNRGAEGREAAKWLKEQLASAPVAAHEIIELGEQYGFSKRTLQRALCAIGGDRKKESFDGAWMWSLLTQGDTEDATTATSL